MAKCRSSEVLPSLLLAACAIPALGGGLVSSVVAPLRWSTLEDKLDFGSDDDRALEIKSEYFWQPVLKAAQDVEPGHHAELYKEAADVLAKLPENNSYVRAALQSALTSLHNADDTLAEQASANLQLATEKLAHPASSWEGDFSILTGTQKWLSLALLSARRLIGLNYKERLHGQVEQRRAEIMPSLRGAGKATPDLLKDTREASNKAFDILKYDIYNRDVPKTPEAAKEVANRIVEAARETRHGFLEPVLSSVDGLARDARGENDLPSATVDQALASGFASDGEDATHATHLKSAEV